MLTLERGKQINHNRIGAGSGCQQGLASDISMNEPPARTEASKRESSTTALAPGWLRTLTFCLLSLAVLLPTAKAAPPVSVFVSVVPEKTFVTRIGGNRVQVGVMVQPGSNPHTYEPTPRQMTALAGADLYFRIGIPFERSWMSRIRHMNPEMRVVNLRAGLSLRRLEAHHHDGSNHARTPLDPHIWTNPRLVISMAAQIRDALIRVDPAGAAVYKANYQAFVADLRVLDAKIQDLLSGLDDRRFLVFHPAWGYFAEAYGLEQIAIQIGGKPPGAAALARLIKRAKREDIHTIFVQPQYSKAPALAVARAIDAKLVQANPLAADYIANLLEFARSLREALR